MTKVGSAWVRGFEVQSYEYRSSWSGTRLRGTPPSPTRLLEACLVGIGNLPNRVHEKARSLSQTYTTYRWTPPAASRTGTPSSNLHDCGLRPVRKSSRRKLASVYLLAPASAVHALSCISQETRHSTIERCESSTSRKRRHRPHRTSARTSPWRACRPLRVARLYRAPGPAMVHAHVRAPSGAHDSAALRVFAQSHTTKITDIITHQCNTRKRL